MRVETVALEETVCLVTGVVEKNPSLELVELPSFTDRKSVV